MRKFYLLAMTMLAMLLCGGTSKAEGWPSNYQGVMLQGFYWDSYTETNWANLEKQADELSKYFTLIWVPNSAQSMGSPSMGYAPIYWFTHHNSSFGTEAQLRSMIKTYKEKGVGIIEDVVVNHRAGMSNWYNFPTETYNGKTYSLTNGSICSTDEVWSDGGHGCPASYKGAPDTGEDFSGARDLDHTNAAVQDAVKNYCKFLLDDLGYAGFRLDMVKGYGGQYTKIYNQYAKPKFCVGEYWDGSYDKVSAWIESTGKESAAFDFPFKYAVNEAFASGDMTKLSWKANGATDQPAGLIHWWYPQYAITFIDNHDTYRDGSKFNGNVVAANAFMLCSPGTPCVFLPHYTANKKAIQTLIDIRNEVGVHNQSAVKVLRLNRNCYMAEVTGTKGRLVVKIGSEMAAPDGYSDSDIKISGTDYCVWATTSGQYDPVPDPTPNFPSSLYMIGNVNDYNWDTTKGVQANGKEGVYTWSSVTVNDVDAGYGYFAFATKLGANWDIVNSSDRYGAPSNNTPIAQGGSGNVTLYAAGVNASGSQSWKIAAGTYSVTVNLKTMKISVAAAGQNPEPDPDPNTYPDILYLMGHISGYDWSTADGEPALNNKGVYTWTRIKIDDADNGYGYFAFATQLGNGWDEVNSSDRYGATSADKLIMPGVEEDILIYPANVSASGSQSWKAETGTYTITANLATNKVMIQSATTGIEGIEDSYDGPTEYFTLQGVRVEKPGKGIYIRVRGNKAEKVVF